jgi:hypothetical protein
VEEWPPFSTLTARLNSAFPPLETAHTPQRQRAKQDGVQFINLSQHWFASLSHLRSVTDNWREDYNHRRPHADPIDDCCALLDESLANAMRAQLRCCSRLLIGTKRMLGRWTAAVRRSVGAVILATLARQPIGLTNSGAEPAPLV